MRISPIRAQEVIGKLTAFFDEPPKTPQNDFVPDGPLLGNGDLGVSLGGTPDRQTWYLCKNDFWVQAHVGETREQRTERLLGCEPGDRERRTGTRIIPVGRLDIDVPGLAGAKYLQEQDIYHAEVRGTFHRVKEKVSLHTCSWVCAAENLLIIELRCGERSPGKVTVHPFAGEKGQYERFAYSDGVSGDTVWVRYAANPQNVEGRRIAAMAARVLGTEPAVIDTLFDKNLSFDPEPGTAAYIVLPVLSDLDDRNCLDAARERARALDVEEIAELKRRHRAWWADFWSASLVEFGDPLLEQYYYGSQYILASSTRTGRVVPGLFGNWVTSDRPRWTGSYTLNYNYESPFWALFTANHGGITRSYPDTLLDVIPIGRMFAKEKLGCRGIYLPVELGPWGTICSTLFHGQKSNALYASINMLLDFYYTWDIEFARRVYPYLTEVADFWEDYLVREGDLYAVIDDALGEVYQGTPNRNPIITIALLKFFLKAIITIAGELSVDPERIPVWREILEHLPGYTTFEHGGKTVFRLTEQGVEWNEHRGFAPFCPMYPCGEVSISSDETLRRIAYDTFVEQGTWDDFNAFHGVYAVGARVGYDPAELLRNLRRQCITRGFPNLFIFHGGGGIEECNGIPAAVNEMMLQSHDFTLRIFPNWHRELDASFVDLRAYGAHLVTAELEDGDIRYVLIRSERGRPLAVANPWPGRSARVFRNGKAAGTAAADVYRTETSAGDGILLIPEGEDVGTVEGAIRRITGGSGPFEG